MSDELRNELEQMLSADKSMRERLWRTMQEQGPSSPEFAAAKEEATEASRRNTARLVAILDAHGWPGKSTVGETACMGAFLVLQHADLSIQLKYLPLIRGAAEAGEIERKDLALLEDRVRVKQGKPQLYGSQFRHGPDGKPELCPIEDEDHVDERRASVGLSSLAEYLQRTGHGHLIRKRAD